jgi:hypothetical protein
MLTRTIAAIPSFDDAWRWLRYEAIVPFYRVYTWLRDIPAAVDRVRDGFARSALDEAMVVFVLFAMASAACFTVQSFDVMWRMCLLFGVLMWSNKYGGTGGGRR